MGGVCLIKWANQIYCDEHVKNRKKKIMRAISAGKIKPGVYCVTLSTNPENLFDIMNVNEFKFPYYGKIDIYVLGLARGHDSAISLVIQMLNEVYQNTGDVKVREYYQDRWELC